jgi:syntaxin 5
MYSGDHTQLLFSHITSLKNDPKRFQQNPNHQRLLPQYLNQSNTYKQYSQDMKSFFHKSLRLNEMIMLCAERFNRLQKIMGEKSLFFDNSAQINQLTLDIKNEFLGIQGIITALSDEMKQSKFNHPPNASNQGFLLFGNDTNQMSSIQTIKSVVLDHIKDRFTTLSTQFTTLLQQHARSSFQSSRKGLYEHENTLLQTHQQHVQHYQQQQLQPTHFDQPLQSPPQNTPNPSIPNNPYAPQSQPQSHLQPSDHPQQRSVVNNNDASYSTQQLRQRGNTAMTSISTNATNRRPQHRNKAHMSILEAELSENESGDIESSGGGRYNDGPDFGALVDQTLLQPQTVAFESQNDTYFTSRQQSMQQITSTIQDVAAMHVQLTDLIHKQEETVARIDANTEEMAVYIEGANEQIMDLYEFSNNNQWLLIKIFAILIVFAIFFISVIS